MEIYKSFDFSNTYSDFKNFNQINIGDIKMSSDFSTFLDSIETKYSHPKYLEISEGPSIQLDSMSPTYYPDNQLALLDNADTEAIINSSLVSNEYSNIDSVINSIESNNSSNQVSKPSTISQDNESSTSINKYDLSPSTIDYKNINKDVLNTDKPKPSLKEIELWVTKAAEKYGMDPNLIMAIIKAESSFNNQCISKSGAVGLMQLMPATAKEMGLQVDNKVDERWDPQKNIETGVAYITKYHKIISKYFGKTDWNLTLAGYNCGPNRVIREGKIPNIKETKDYVSRINKYWNNFKKA